MSDSRFGPYRLEGVLGRGGMGTVHRAVDTRKNRTVALKLLAPEFAGDEEFRARFRLEAEAAGKLSDPHVVPIHDFGEIEGRFFIDMRLVDGVDLATLVRRDGPLPVRRVAGIVAQVASALDAAHHADLVHRDVKPTNILVSERGGEDFVYLIDFGIVRASTDHRITATGRAVGTFSYMAPERFRGPGGDAPGVDVYALGCVLHEALTGEPPFGYTDPAVSMYAHLTEPPPRPSSFRRDVSPAFDAVVARAMAKNPDDRYAGAVQFAAALRQAASPAPPPVVPPIPAPRGPATVRLPPPTPVGPPPPPIAPVANAFRAADLAAIWLTAAYLAVTLVVPAPSNAVPVWAVVVSDVVGAVLAGLSRYALGRGEPRAVAVYTGLVGGLAVNSGLVIGFDVNPAGVVPFVLVAAGLAVAGTVRLVTADPVRRDRSLRVALVATGLGAVAVAAVWSVLLVLRTGDPFLVRVVATTTAGGLLLLVAVLVVRLWYRGERPAGAVLATTAVALGIQLAWRGVYWVFSPGLRPFLGTPSRIVFLAGTGLGLLLLLGYLLALVRGARRAARA